MKLRVREPLLAGGIMLLVVGAVGLTVATPFTHLFAAPYALPLIAGIPLTIAGSRRIVDDGSALVDAGLMSAGVALAGLSIAATPILATYLYTTLVWHHDDARVIGLGAALGVSVAMGVASIPMWAFGGSRKRPRTTTPTPVEAQGTDAHGASSGATETSPIPRVEVAPLGLSLSWEL